MGCFATCFGTCKPARRRRRRSLKTAPSLLDHLQKNQSIEDFKVPQLIDEEEEGGEEQEQEVEEIDKAEIPTELLSPNSIDEKGEKDKASLSGRKKVTFDLNVKFYENLSKEEEFDDDYVEVIDEESVDEKQQKKERKAKANCEGQCGSDSSSSSLFSYPSNHRYQNCRDSDDEFDEIMSSDEGSDFDEYTDDEYGDDEDEEYGGEVESGVQVETREQSSESLFSLSIDSRKQQLGSAGGDKEVNSPLKANTVTRNESTFVDSVLNPVENLTQWKVVKAKSRLASRDQAKENLNSEQDFEFPVKKAVTVQENLNSDQDFGLSVKKEIAVDTSLSTWLVGSEQRTVNRSNSRNSSDSVGNASADRNSVSPNKFEDRPILGALTLEEIRQMSAASTPRKKSPSRSPDDMPIIGTVGSYWSHTGQSNNSGSSINSTRSRYRESAEVVWDSTPFETRLEKALEKEANCEEVLAV